MVGLEKFEQPLHDNESEWKEKKRKLSSKLTPHIHTIRTLIDRKREQERTLVVKYCRHRYVDFSQADVTAKIKRSQNYTGINKGDTDISNHNPLSRNTRISTMIAPCILRRKYGCTPVPIIRLRQVEGEYWDGFSHREKKSRPSISIPRKAWLASFLMLLCPYAMVDTLNILPIGVIVYAFGLAIAKEGNFYEPVCYSQEETRGLHASGGYQNYRSSSIKTVV